MIFHIPGCNMCYDSHTRPTHHGMCVNLLQGHHPSYIIDSIPNYCTMLHWCSRPSGDVVKSAQVTIRFSHRLLAHFTCVCVANDIL